MLRIKGNDAFMIKLIFVPNVGAEISIGQTIFQGLFSLWLDANIESAPHLTHQEPNVNGHHCACRCDGS